MQGYLNHENSQLMPDECAPMTSLPEAKSATINAATVADEREGILGWITEHQRLCRNYLAIARSRSAAWTFINIFSSALAAAAASGPAVGGASFTNLIQHMLSLPSSSLVWQVLCATSFVMALVAAVTASISRTRDYPTRIAIAEKCVGELDALRVELQFDSLAPLQAARILAREISRTPFCV